MAFVFDKCCFCIELKTGCLIIGYLNLIASLIISILTIIGVVATNVVVQQAGHEQGIDHRQLEAVSTIVTVVSIILLLFLVLFLAFTIVLLVGVHQGKRGHIKAYLIYALIFLIIYIVVFFAGFASKPINGGQVVQQLVTILLNIYFLLVIRSYYFLLGNTSRGPAVYSTA